MFGRMPKLAWGVGFAMSAFLFRVIEAGGYRARLDRFSTQTRRRRSTVTVLSARQGGFVVPQTGHEQTLSTALVAALRGARR